MFSEIFLIDDGPRSPLWNMAADEWLFEHVGQGEAAYIRFYQWSEPTLSLGYFQRFAEIAEHFGEKSCPTVIRRSTGGGAIVHDRDLTYSVALPLRARWSAAADAVYALFHEALIRALATRAIQAQSCPQTLHGLAGEPFLCFQRRAQGDVLLAGSKIAGSAQRRKSGSLLQHGSVLLGRSAFAPELPGLSELSGQEIAARELQPDWLREVLENRTSESSETIVREWSTQEISEIEAIAERKFNSPQWAEKR